MQWVHWISYFFGGAFVVNAIPHFVSGVLGRAFQSPFAKPPGEGLSSSAVNVLWGSFNIAISYLLVLQVGTFDPRSILHAVSVGSGGLVMALVHARAFGRFHGGNLSSRV